MVALSLLSLLLPTAALAAPWRRDSFQGRCSVPASAFKIPSNFDALATSPNLVLMGFGIQNYTCNANGTFDNIGAIGQMFDISCLYGKPEFATIQDDAFKLWDSCPRETDPLSATMAQRIKAQFDLTVDGQHYFANKNGKLEAVWDLTSSGPFKGNQDAIVFAHKIQTAPSPDGADNIVWVELKKDSGGLANTVYRINTVKGQPPSSCSPNSSTSVKYATKYLLL
ncbi:hypothetical protein F5888DRAFT_259250 [Russula emetica]|nr:hypothetical protein F5888DRAFT_259250 [Russula emetica]